MIPQLQVIKPYLTIVDIGFVRMYFSYDACIAFRDSRISFPGQCAYDPYYREYTNITTKHAKELGCDDFDDSTTFADDLESALAANF